MHGHDIIVIGASAGGVPAVCTILRGLPPHLPASIFVALHTAASSPGVLPQIFSRAGALKADFASTGERVRHGRIYVPRPDHHLLLRGGEIVVARGPKENGFRPAVDPLFRTASRTYGARVIGVVLSGGLDDGTQGLMEIKRRGGVAVVQDPNEADFSSMPASAVEKVNVDRVLPVEEIAAELVRWVHVPVPKGAGVMRTKKNGRPDPAEMGEKWLAEGLKAPPSAFTCPECGGALWEMRDNKLVRYQCHVGHRYTADGLVAAQTERVEAAMWTALRSLEESAELRRRMAERNADRWPRVAERYRQMAADDESRADSIRAVLLNDKPRKKNRNTPTLERVQSVFETPPTVSRKGSNGRRGKNGKKTRVNGNPIRRQQRQEHAGSNSKNQPG
jgi:two-component system chemotaxis response regulator CheB